VAATSSSHSCRAQDAQDLASTPNEATGVSTTRPLVGGSNVNKWVRARCVRQRGRCCSDSNFHDMTKEDRRVALVWSSWRNTDARKAQGRRQSGMLLAMQSRGSCRCWREAGRQQQRRSCGGYSSCDRWTTTRRTRHGDVSAGHGQTMRSSSSKSRRERLEAEVLADLLHHFARHGLLHPTVDPCAGGKQLLLMGTTSLSSEMRRSSHGRVRSGGQGCSRRGSRVIRT
jgi:hypothetical protein